MNIPFKKLMLLVVLCLLLTALPIYAQEATPEATPGGETVKTEETAPVAQGLSTLMLLVGLGAVALVTGVPVLRDNFSGNNKGL
jgi:hypothetical protein